MTRLCELNCNSSLRRLFTAACVSFAGATLAQPAELPLAFGFESKLVADLEKAPHEQIKAIYVDCSNEAETRLVGAGEAAACSIVYETLKRRVFEGDFDALLAWSRAQRAAQLGAKEPRATAAVASK